MAWTFERIEALSPNDRATVFANALKADSDKGDELVTLIRNSGLPLCDGTGITREHPLVWGMEKIVNSDEARSACRKAVENGFPALAGVDPMLAEAFPGDYGKHNQTTLWVGHLVAEIMRDMGFRELNKQGKMPDGCVARTGMMWDRKVR